ncbi:MAG: cytochrome c biogenesis protein CcsA [Oleispira sp.]|nr:cytochrome c biogenesis protein CcsA [Oleispira sp.]
MSGTYSAAFFAFPAALLYLFAAFRQWQTLSHKKEANKPLVLLFGATASIIHTLLLAGSVVQHGGFNFGFFNVGILISLVISLLVIISSISKPLENLLVAVFPMAALILLIDSITPNSDKVSQLTGGLGWHIILSILAYSILVIAAIQAVLLYMQSKQLKSHKTSGLIKALPPLQTMDALLFEMIWIGMVLLTAAFVVGWPHITDIQGQHLVHKTALSIMSWLVFATLLIGRFNFGWRGITASRWTLVGTGFLIMAYFGSKFVLELVL